MRPLALLAVLVTLAQPARAAADVCVCRTTGAVMAGCAALLAGRAHAEPIDALARLSCCDVRHLESSAPPARVSVDHGAAHAPAPLALALVPLGAPPPREIVAFAPRVEPRATAGPTRLPRYLAVLHILG